MVLSIGMIVKNEEKHLRKCLEALQPIITQVESELIIADTGSTDNTVEIAREYTPLVFEIDWNDNFAEARNHTIRKAKGEWFMFLDADEVFADTEDLINFFNSGDYKNYGYATHFIRNLVGGGRYELSIPTRLFKKNRNTKFGGIIHEYIPLQPPRKDLNSYSIHTGYLFETDPELRMRKHERNIALLLKLYHRDPLDVRNIAHIANDYYAVGNTEEQKRFLDIGFEYLKNQPDNPYFHYYYRRLAKYFLYLETPEGRESAIAYAEDYLSKCNHLSATAMDMYYIIGRATQLLERFDEAIEAYEKCWELVKEYQLGQLDTTEVIYDVLDCINESFAAHIPFSIVLCYSQKKDYDNAFSWCEHIDLRVNNILDLYLGFMEVSKRYDQAVSLYKMIAALEGKDDTLFENLRDKFEVNMMINRNAKEMVASFTQLDATNDYIRLQHLRYADWSSSDNLPEKINYFLQPEKMENALAEVVIYSDVTYIALKNAYRFEDIVEMLDIDAAIELIAQMSVKRSEFSETIVQLIEKQRDNDISKIPLKAAYWWFCLYSQSLALDKPMEDDQKLLLFKQYINMFYRYMQSLYRPELLTDEGVLSLGGTFRFGYYMHKADACLNGEDELNYMRYMKTALAHSGRFKKYVQLRISEYKNKSSNKENEALNNQLRLSILTRSLKANITQMIDTGNKEQAEKLINEYEQINPEDGDIKRIREKLTNM